MKRVWRLASGLPGLILLAMVLALGACADSKPRFEGVNRISQNGQNLFFEAQKVYAVVRAMDMHGPRLKTSMDDVVAHLDGAIVNDPKCPLFHSKKGEVLIELGPDGYDRASSDLNNALKLQEDWVPAWIALADLAARRNDQAAGESYLSSAEKALSVVQSYQKQSVPPFRIMGLEINFEKPKDPNDPKLPEETRHALLLNWLQASEQWTLENPSLLMPGPGGQGMTVNGESLFRRLRAHIAFERAVLALARNEKAPVVMPLFDKVFEWDPDFFPARIEQAHQLSKLGQHREAERILRPYVDSKDPKLANNARLLFEMASIYADWYLTAIDAPEAQTISQEADKYFTHLFEVNPYHGQGWIKRAQMYAKAGALAKRKDTLQDAQRWLANAQEALQNQTEQIKQLQAEINKSLQALP